ncbi:MAG TPA: WbqC family protein [Mariniphaga sp.]|nr:WbqC family protein [Mariniphaga sp.]
MGSLNSVLLSTACFAPVQYFTKLEQFEVIYIEQHEHFQKQTFRNRYEILGANGLLSLVIPVVKGRGRKINIKDLLISYDTDWQRNHWRTIFSAYNSSPFFEFYQDDIRPFFEKPWKYLLDYNMAGLEVLTELTGLEPNIQLTTDFEAVPNNNVNLREAISPKSHKFPPDQQFKPHPYTQVFTDKFGFTPNLSILDLIFNEGPNTMVILQKSIF